MKKPLPPGGDNRRWRQRALERERAKRYVVRSAVNPAKSIVWDTRCDRVVYLCGTGGLLTDTSSVAAEHAAVALNRAYTAWTARTLQAA